MRRMTVLAVLLIPAVACAGDATSDLLGGFVGMVQSNPKVIGALAILTGIQHAAPWLAMIPSLWGGNTKSEGAGSGWSRFWRKVEDFGIDKILPKP